MSFTELLPHAPQVGIFVAPGIPQDKLANALADYAKSVSEADVMALFDATLMGSAKDGAVFTADRLIFQNNDLQPVHEVSYHDIIQVESRRKLLGGRRIVMTVNRGRATFELEMDFSGKPDAAEYVLRFLREASLRAEDPAAGPAGGVAARRTSGRSEAVDTIHPEHVTDLEAVAGALQKLHGDGLISTADMEAVIDLLEERRGT